MWHSDFCGEGILTPSTRCHFERDHCKPDAVFSIESSLTTIRMDSPRPQVTRIKIDAGRSLVCATRHTTSHGVR
jgi:hypothetical protein